MPFTLTDCREAFITVMQVMPELASVFEVGITKECKSFIVYCQCTGTNTYHPHDMYVMITIVSDGTPVHRPFSNAFIHADMPVPTLHKPILYSVLLLL